MIRKALAMAVLSTVAILAAGRQEASAAPGGPDGATIFRQRCQSCHSVDPARTLPLGPNLAGVVGRKAASAKFNYSPALKAANVTWTRQSLDRYLTSPPRMVPGTRMMIALSNPAQRAAVIDFLAAPK